MSYTYHIISKSLALPFCAVISIDSSELCVGLWIVDVNLPTRTDQIENKELSSILGKLAKKVQDMQRLENALETSCKSCDTPSLCALFPCAILCLCITEVDLMKTSGPSQCSGNPKGPKGPKGPTQHCNGLPVTAAQAAKTQLSDFPRNTLQCRNNIQHVTSTHVHM